ncbi:MAG: hypothetical protein KJ626_11410 [Verrucomicrobia bacterium]|nr:hypothetical protein [Verrucomicrobiota bacterium]
MKVAVCAEEGSKASWIGKCVSKSPFFVLADTDSGEFESMPNPAIGAKGHHGRVAAEALIRTSVKSVIGTHFGHKAMRLLAAEGISVYQTEPGVVEHAVQAHKAGRLSLAQEGNPCHDSSSHRSCCKGGAGHGGTCCHG